MKRSLFYLSGIFYSKGGKSLKRKILILLAAIILLAAAGVWQQLIERGEGKEPPEGAIQVAKKGQGKVGTVSSNDTFVLSKIISGEARGESYIGQVAVGAVIVNRVKNPNFPNTVYGVVFEPGAFDAVSDGQYYRAPAASSVKAARVAINGWDPTGGAIYYWNPATATSRWIWSRPIIARIGRHVFAR
jgi:spore germination cell wall hydrolase CwlJ-like protein